jgi:anti-sigma-K factor RskA
MMHSELENHVIDLLPAYVLDALTDDEMSQVVQHLAGCRTCQAELSQLQSVVDDLPLALAATAPPPRVKLALMEAIHSRQGEAVPASTPSFWQKLVAFFRMPLPAIGAVLILVLAIGNIFLFRQLSLTSQPSGNSMRVIALANTQNAPLAEGTLIINQLGDYGTLVVDKLAQLDPNQQYQVWLLKAGQRTSGGLFSVNHDGYASLEIMAPLPLTEYDSVGVTIEPVGGSPAPTGSKVLGGTIPR